MNKVALITDNHFGIKNGDEKWLNSQLNFFRLELIPYLKKHGISHIIHLGDLFNDRESTDNRVLNEVYNLFKYDLSEFTIDILVGNHDSYFKSRIDISVINFLGQFENVNIISDITLKKFNKTDILLVPWQTDWEEFTIKVANKNNECSVCMGHFPVSGFQLNNKSISNEGIRSDVFFKNFKKTFSGHFHTRSAKTQDSSKIIYIGNTYHLTRNDIGDDRGFCIFDLNTLKHEFVNTTKTIKFISLKYPQEIDPNPITNNVIDVHVTYDDSYNEKSFMKYIETIEKYNPLEPVKIKGETIQKLVEITEDEVDKNTTLDLIKLYVDREENITDKDEVKNIIEDLYNTCTKRDN